MQEARKAGISCIPRFLASSEKSRHSASRCPHESREAKGDRSEGGPVTHRLNLVIILVLAALLGLGVPATAATSSFAQGQAIQLSLGRVSASYQVDWYSDLDGYLGTGAKIVVSTLSVGTHTISYYIFRVRDGALLYNGSTTVTITAPSHSGGSTSGSTSGTTGGSTGGDRAPGEFEPVSTLLLGCPDTYLVDGMYPGMIRGIHGVATAHIYVDNAYARNDVIALLGQAGVSSSDYDFKVVPVDTIWMRDYGPLFVRRGGALQLVDLDYSPGRDHDDR